MVGQRFSFCLFFPHTKNKNKTLLSALSNTYPLLMHFVYVPKIYSMEQYKNGFVSSFFSLYSLLLFLSIHLIDIIFFFSPQCICRYRRRVAHPSVHTSLSTFLFLPFSSFFLTKMLIWVKKCTNI